MPFTVCQSYLSQAVGKIWRQLCLVTAGQVFSQPSSPESSSWWPGHGGWSPRTRCWLLNTAGNVSFHPHNSWEAVLLLWTLFYVGGNWSSERLSHFSKEMSPESQPRCLPPTYGRLVWFVLMIIQTLWYLWKTNFKLLLINPCISWITQLMILYFPYF